MAMQLLPSFQSFLESARLSPPSPIVYKQHAKSYEAEARRAPFSSFYKSLDHHADTRMYHLASFTAREYERAIHSPDESSSIGSWSPTATDTSSSDEDTPTRSRVATSTLSSLSRMPAAKASKKKYLKEKQRCEIVRRVRGGEKQAHLAKEFGVSRAAVCYLLKHQTEILSRCGGESSKLCPTTA